MRLGVFSFSLSATLASVAGSSCSNVLWTNRVQSCLSVSPKLGFLGSFCSSFLSCWRLFSILVTSTSFVLMAVVSHVRSASSACLLLRLPPSPPASFSACLLRLPPSLPASFSTCLLLRLPPSPPVSFSACLLLRLPPSPPASFSACLLLRRPPSPPASFSPCLLLRLPPFVDLFLVRFCAWEGQPNIYFECLWDPLFVRQAPAVCQICVQQTSPGVCLLNCLAAKDRGMHDTYVSACVQHNGLRTHMMGLPFKMYCNYNVTRSDGQPQVMHDNKNLAPCQIC